MCKSVVIGIFFNFLDDFVENYFQWSELGEDDVEDKDLAKKANSNKPEHMKDREVSRDDDAKENRREKEPELVIEDKCCKLEFVRNDSKISEGKVHLSDHSNESGMSHIQVVGCGSRSIYSISIKDNMFDTK